MASAEIREWYAEQIEWYKKQIEWNNREIEWLTKQMGYEKDEIRRLREYVWSKGVLTPIEWEIWGKEGYESAEYRKYKNQRRRQYRERKTNEARIAEYERRLEEA